MPRTKH